MPQPAPGGQTKRKPRTRAKATAGGRKR
jgi:hypothetical protein